MDLKKLVIGAALIGGLGLLAMGTQVQVNDKKELSKYEFTDPVYIEKVKNYWKLNSLRR